MVGAYILGSGATDPSISAGEADGLWQCTIHYKYTEAVVFIAKCTIHYKYRETVVFIARTNRDNDDYEAFRVRRKSARFLARTDSASHGNTPARIHASASRASVMTTASPSTARETTEKVDEWQHKNVSSDVAKRSRGLRFLQHRFQFDAGSWSDGTTIGRAHSALLSEAPWREKGILKRRKVVRVELERRGDKGSGFLWDVKWDMVWIESR